LGIFCILIFEPDCAVYTLGTVFETGSGTTAAAMMAYFLALIHHPQYQTKFHERVDRVVGDKRLPDFDDVPNLPYCRAAMKETLR
jgi:cytochrome P450